MGTLSKSMLNKYIAKLRGGLELSNGELRALQSALNYRTNPVQLDSLLMAAENCNCTTPKGTLVGFESYYSLDIGTAFRPKFRVG